MKHILWPCLGLILLVGISLGANLLVYRQIEGLRTELRALSEAVEKADYAGAARSMERLEKKAEQNLDLLSALLAHDETESHMELLEAVKADLSLGLSTDCLKDAAALDEQLRHMERVNDLTVGNLF